MVARLFLWAGHRRPRRRYRSRTAAQYRFYQCALCRARPPARRPILRVLRFWPVLQSGARRVQPNGRLGGHRRAQQSDELDVCRSRRRAALGDAAERSECKQAAGLHAILAGGVSILSSMGRPQLAGGGMKRQSKTASLRRAADLGTAMFSALLHVCGVRPGLLALTGVSVLVAAPSAYANPKSGQVSAGSAAITQTSSSRLDIVQSTDRAAIDWQSFSIAPHEQTNFQQPAPTSMTLNRVAPGDPSVIAG